MRQPACGRQQAAAQLHNSKTASVVRPISRPLRTQRIFAAAAAERAFQPPPPANITAQPGTVISHLVGKKLLHLGPGHAAVPLLHPVEHELPFAASLHIHTSTSSSTSSTSTSSTSVGVGAGAPSVRHAHQEGTGGLVALYYVVSGRGHFSSSTGVQPLAPGDSIIALQGSAAFGAGPLPAQPAAAAGTSGAPDPQQQTQAKLPAWTQLMAWLQQTHAKAAGAPPAVRPAAAAAAATAAAQAATSAASVAQHQLVMLQLLLPSELLTGQLLTHHAGHCHEVAMHLPWGAGGALLPRAAAAAAAAGAAGAGATSAAATAAAGQADDAGALLPLPGNSIDEDEVCAFLVDSSFQSDGGEQLQQQQQQQQQQQAHGAAASGAADSRVELRQQQILKRALSEVGAFRLPHQTNRLSLLFGPHISPAVSCTLGVEVFERGHVTPLHVHTTAHELFFVLAGTGEAVFGSSSSSSSSRSAPASGGDGHKRQQHHAATRRVPLSAGDVVVFSPGVLHGVDNLSSGQLYCLQMMLPNESFAEYVRSGELAGTLDVGAVFAASHCG